MPESPSTTVLLAERHLLRLITISLLVLVVATGPLWRGSTVIPAIPWVSIPGLTCNLANTLGVVLLGGLFLSQLAGACRWYSERIACGISAACLAGAFLLDQARMQVWAWQFLLLYLTYALFPSGQRIRTGRGLVLVIYFYSAVSKLDLAFCHQLGPMLVGGLARSIHLDAMIRPEHAPWLAGLFPLIELTIAGLLLSPQSRLYGLRSSLLMHLALLLTLGPLGLNHNPSVLLWNVYFLIQNVILFRGALEPAPSITLERWWRWGLLLYPALNWIGWCDPWPAWVVYSERRVQITPLVHHDSLALLPDEIQSQAGQPAPFSDWVPLNLDAVAFNAWRTPLVPEARYRGAVWLELSSEIPSEHVGLRIQPPPYRWSTTRSEPVTIHGRWAMTDWVRQRWANTASWSTDTVR